MKIKTDNHFDLVYRFFELMAVHIIKQIADNKISDEEQLKTMVIQFISDVAIDLDQFYIKDKEIGNKKFYPMICFRDTEYINESQEIVIPDGNDLFHETLPYGVGDDVFEMSKKKLGFIYGNECSEVEM
jgi:hypothetical protein